MKRFDVFKSLIEKSGKFQISALKNGSSVFKLTPKKSINVVQLKKALNKKQIFLPNWNDKDQCFYIKVNDSLVYNDMQKTAKSFLKST